MTNARLKQKRLSLSKEIAYIAITCALLLGGQFVFSFFVGVEIVTLILVCFSYTFGVRRGIICAVCFSLLRCVIYGFYPTAIILYLIYYPLLTLVFGLLGKLKILTAARTPKGEILKVVLLTLIGAAMTAIFSLLDDIITPLFYGLSRTEMLAYFYSSFTAMLPQVICTIVTVSTLFLPLSAVFERASKI